MNNPLQSLIAAQKRLQELGSANDDNGASQVLVLLQKTRDPKRRAHLNDLWQRLRSRGESRPISPSACWRQRPRPRVTTLPTHWSNESEKARARRLSRERNAK